MLKLSESTWETFQAELAKVSPNLVNMEDVEQTFIASVDVCYTYAVNSGVEEGFAERFDAIITALSPEAKAFIMTALLACLIEMKCANPVNNTRIMVLRRRNPQLDQRLDFAMQMAGRKAKEELDKRKS